MTESASRTDESVVADVQAGDRELYAELMSRYQDKLLRYTGAMLQDSDAAADVVQEAFVKAYLNLHSFRLKKKFSSWIYRIAHNETMNALKKSRRVLRLPDDFDQASDENLDEKVMEQEMKERVHQCLEKLPPKFSEPLALYYLEDQPYEAIGEILHLSSGTVGSRINRAKRYLRNICQNT